MAYFDTYLELQDTVADWLNRKDLNEKIPQFIRLFEARASRELRTHDMVKRATATVNSGYFVVPSDWRETIALLRTSNDLRSLRFVSIENSFEERARYHGTNPCPPEIYTQMDGKFFLYPAPQGDVDLELVYRASIPTLSNGVTDPMGNDISVPTNWLLEKSPDIYLFGSLAEAEPYLKNDERVALWQSKADRIIASMQIEAERASFPQGALAMKRKTFG
jgi:hypothetical protein